MAHWGTFIKYFFACNYIITSMAFDQEALKNLNIIYISLRRRNGWWEFLK